MAQEESQQVLERLFAPYADRGLFVELRGIKPEESPVPGPRAYKHFFPLDDLERVRLQAMVWAAEREVYFGVLPRSERSGTLDAIHRAAWLVADFDDCPDAALDKITAASRRGGEPLYPELAILSGGGLHVYYPLHHVVNLEEPADRQRFGELQKRLVLFLNADPEYWQISGILRLPGTLNYKYDPPRIVQTLPQALPPAPPRTFQWWDEFLPPLPPPPPVPEQGYRPPDRGRTIYPATRELFETPAPPGQFNSRCKRITVSMLRLGHDPEFVRSKLIQLAQLSGKLDPTHVREIDRWILWGRKRVQVEV